MEERELTLPDIDENIEVHCIHCGELMNPDTVSIDVTYKDQDYKVHNCKLYRCINCPDYEVYSAKTVDAIEHAVWNAAEE